MGGDEPAQQMWMGLKEVFSPDFVVEVDQLCGTTLESRNKVIASGTSVYAGEKSTQPR